MSNTYPAAVLKCGPVFVLWRYVNVLGILRMSETLGILPTFI